MNVRTATVSRVDDPPARPALLGEVLVIGVLLFAYDHIKRIAHSRPTAAEAHGRSLLRVERVIGIDIERSFNSSLSGHHVLSLAASYSYELLWWSTALAVLVVAYCWCPDKYRRLRNTLVAINLAALVVFFAWPVMPPRLLDGSGFVDSVARAGFGAKHVGRLPADQYAAMPSLHAAWAVFTAWAVWVLSTRWELRVIAVLLPVLTVVDVMATGNHYLLDAVAGAALAGLAAWSVTRAMAAPSAR
jgi:membrane-associated phospholipid phosphatase